MIYKCTTPGCLIAESSAPFAAAINCPVCQQALVAETTEVKVSEKEMDLITALPYVIAYPLKRTLEEQNYWKKINYFKDTFLNYLKYLGLLTASEFFNSQLTNRRMVDAFQKNLAQPSFGSWNAFIRDCIVFLKEQQHEFFCPELVAYYERIETGNKRKIYKGDIEYIDSNGDAQLKKQEASAIGMLINFRNRFLGHGLTLEEDDSKTLWEEYYPIFKALLEEIDFVKSYPMYKREHGETYLLQGVELELLAQDNGNNGTIWIENQAGKSFEILPFYIVPGALAIPKEAKEQVLAYESFTGKTIKFFSPEGTEKLTSGSILEKLNLLLRSKKEESPYSPENFTKELFEKRIAEENKIQLSTLILEKKVIEGIYQHRETIEVKLREWIGARANIFFIAAEAGSGKTNLLVEIQKQYAERKLACLFIRAARMEKTSLKEQIAYQLNLDPIIDLKEYTSIAGTQAEPTFILIDGLNEASNAEAIWNEVLEISTLFEPGSLKFVLTNRANSKVDLERYEVTEQQEQYIYGERNDFEKEKGLTPYVFWLTPLDMKEMESAWDAYVKTDKKRFKPLFEFNDLATFDRGLYLQINNPLVLRIFLETYQGKKLPEKGINHLHIWKDWFATFSENEQHFMHVLANEMWKNGANEISLDVLLNNEETKEFLQTDNISGPYPRLINLGWISRYHKEFTTYLSFTVEGLLLYLLGVKLEKQRPEITVPDIHLLISEGTKLQKAAVESFLGEQALLGKIDLIAKLIDEGEDKLKLCVTPLLYFLKSQGVEKTIEKLLENPTENDWKALLWLNQRMDELGLHFLKKQLNADCMVFNPLNSKNSLLLGLQTISQFEIDIALGYISKIDIALLQFDDELFFQLGLVEMNFGNYDKALEYFLKSLHLLSNNQKEENDQFIALYNIIGTIYSTKRDHENALNHFNKCLILLSKYYGEDHANVATIYSNLGVLYSENGEKEISLKYHQKALDIRLISLGSEHPAIANSYNNFGSYYSENGEYEKSLEFYKKCLKIDLITVGESHPDIAISYDNLGSIYKELGDYEKAIDFCIKALNIRLKFFGKEHPVVAESYWNLGLQYRIKGNYEKALELYLKSLAIKLKTYGKEHPDVASLYNNIGLVYRLNGDFENSLKNLLKSLSILLKTLGSTHPDLVSIYDNLGSLYNSKEEYDKALEYYYKSYDVIINTFDTKHPKVALVYNNLGTVYDSIEDFEKALDFYNKCLEIDIKTLGENHPNVATLFSNMGKVYRKKKDFETALKFYEKSIEIRLEKLGNEHHSVADSYSDFGLVYKIKGEFEKSLEYYKKCLEIDLKTLDIHDPQLKTTYKNVAGIFEELRNYDQALIYYEKCLEIDLVILGNEHPDLVNSLNTIAEIWENKGELLKSLEYYNMTLNIELKQGEENQNLANTYFNIGSIWMNKNDYDNALDYYENCLAIQLKILDNFNSDIASSYNALSVVWFYKREYNKALLYSQKYHDIILKILGEEHSDVIHSHFSLGNLFKTIGQFDKAIESFQKGYEISNKGGFPYKIAECYEALNNPEKALDYYIQSAEIRKVDPNAGLEAEATQESISNAKRLAKELGKEGELPEWMKE